jgi:hypothetical protein
MNGNSSNLDNLLNEAIYESFRSNILNLYHGQERQTLNPNRLPLSLLRNNLSSRYYNTPPQGGYHINEEHEYDIDLDDISSLIFLDITTRFASPVDNKTIRKEKIKEIKSKKVKEEQDECPICLDKINIGEFQKKLTCNHCFHKKCIDRWFKKDNDCCPMCRMEIIKV